MGVVSSGWLPTQRIGAILVQKKTSTDLQNPEQVFSNSGRCFNSGHCSACVVATLLLRAVHRRDALRCRNQL
jgi:hypothetical protein